MNSPIWEDNSWTRLAPLAADANADFCVVGLGGSGLMAIEELVQSGARVIGLDAGAVGGGAAGRNAGFLLSGLADFFPTMVSRFGPALAVELHRGTLAEIDRMGQRFSSDVSRNGILRLAATAEELRDCEAHGALLRHHGFPAEDYAASQGRGLFVPSDASFNPLRCVRSQAVQLLGRGAHLFEHSPVSALSPGRVVTPHGAVSCGAIVVAVDGGLELLLPELKSRVRTARLQMLATAPAPDTAISHPVYWRDGFEYWRQLADGSVALGGFRDAGGAPEWTPDTAPSATVQHRLEQFLREHLKVTAPITHRWAAAVSYTEDRLPVLEEVRPGIFAAGAYSGTGNIVGRLGGRAAAQLAAGKNSTWAELLRTARHRIRAV